MAGLEDSLAVGGIIFILIPQQGEIIPRGGNDGKIISL
jgi:hypothetical protein